MTNITVSNRIAGVPRYCCRITPDWTRLDQTSIFYIQPLAKDFKERKHAIGKRKPFWSFQKHFT